MSLPNEFAIAQRMRDDGYFTRAAGGDRRACSLFARLLAYRLNPAGDPASWGWLTKQPGETNVDGYAEDAIVFSDSRRADNVVDVIVGAGAPGASIGWQEKPRRAGNEWAPPRPLTADELAALTSGTTTPTNPAAPACRFVAPDLRTPLDALGHEVVRLRDVVSHQQQALEAMGDVLAAINTQISTLDTAVRAARPVHVEGRVLGQRIALDGEIWGA